MEWEGDSTRDRGVTRQKLSLGGKDVPRVLVLVALQIMRPVNY